MAMGRILREARERRQLTLSQVAAATRMKVQVAQALEAEDYRKIPAPIYGRGFIRMYAEFVGVDPKPLVAEYMAAVSGPVEKPAPPAQPPPPGISPKTPADQTPSPRPSLTKMTPVARAPHQVRPGFVRPGTPATPPPKASLAFVSETYPPQPSAPLIAPTPPPEPVVAPPPEPVVAPPPEPETFSAPAPLEQREPEPSLQSTPATAVSPVTAPRPDDDLFAWGQSASTMDGVPANEPSVESPAPPPEPESPREPIPSPAPPTAAPDLATGAPMPPSTDAEPVETMHSVETVERGEEQEPPAQTDLEPVSHLSPPRQGKDADDLSAAAGALPLARPPKTTLGPQPAAYMRRPPQRLEPGEEPTLSREREALKTRAIAVLIGVAIVTILLISTLSRCSPPPKEVKRGPIKEKLKMAVEPPPPYVD